MNIPYGCLETIFGFKNANSNPAPFKLDPGSGMEKLGSRIRNKHPGSVTLEDRVARTGLLLKDHYKTELKGVLTITE